jgi:lactate dehydrogenase-like 2-hydroxyacid dehydrogenase
VFACAHQLIAKGSKLKVISNYGAGYDTVDVKTATEVHASVAHMHAECES